MTVPKDRVLKLPVSSGLGSELDQCHFQFTAAIEPTQVQVEGYTVHLSRRGVCERFCSHFSSAMLSISLTLSPFFWIGGGITYMGLKGLLLNLLFSLFWGI